MSSKILYVCRERLVCHEVLLSNLCESSTRLFQKYCSVPHHFVIEVWAAGEASGTPGAVQSRGRVEALAAFYLGDKGPGAAYRNQVVELAAHVNESPFRDHPIEVEFDDVGVARCCRVLIGV